MFTADWSSAVVWQVGDEEGRGGNDFYPHGTPAVYLSITLFLFRL